MTHNSGTELKCPTCKGHGEHRGPVPYRYCLRCAGFGTIVVDDPETYLAPIS